MIHISNTKTTSHMCSQPEEGDVPFWPAWWGPEQRVYAGCEESAALWPEGTRTKWSWWLVLDTQKFNQPLRGTVLLWHTLNIDLQNWRLNSGPPQNFQSSTPLRLEPSTLYSEVSRTIAGAIGLQILISLWDLYALISSTNHLYICFFSLLYDNR